MSEERTENLTEVEMATKNNRKTAQEIIESNNKIIAENNLKSWDDIHAFVLAQRLANKKVGA